MFTGISSAEIVSKQLSKVRASSLVSTAKEERILCYWKNIMKDVAQ